MNSKIVFFAGGIGNCSASLNCPSKLPSQTFRNNANGSNSTTPHGNQSYTYGSDGSSSTTQRIGDQSYRY